MSFPQYPPPYLHCSILPVETFAFRRNCFSSYFAIHYVKKEAEGERVSQLNREGTLQGSKFAVASSSNEQQKPAITTNEQDRYMVAWQEKGLGDWDIHGKEVNSTTGAPLPTLYLIAITPVDEMAPDVACNGSIREYLAVWQQATGSGEAIHASR